MGKLRTITRRTFLISSLAIAGGVAFGTYAVKRDPNNPLTDDLKPDEATFNPWVKIGPEGITLIAPHTDLGQGARHMQALLLAEELDVDLDQFTTSPGVPSEAYWNHALANDAVPFMTSDHSFAADTTRTVATSLIKVLGLQVTGGSSSTPDSYVKLRAAGASARETLKQAAANKTGIPLSQLTTRSAAVHLPDGSSIPYTELAALAAKIQPVKVEKLRDPSKWKLIGKPSQRLDIIPKSTGTLEYGIDLKMDNMRYATVKTNPRLGGEMKSMDDTAAKAMRGVEKIIPITGGVAVIADNSWRAIKAANAIKFEWGEAPYPAEMDAHWKEVSDSFTPERLDKEWRHDGDVENGLRTGSTIEAEYRAPYVAHQPLEPLSATMLMTDERIDVWVSHQIPRIAVTQVAKITGYAEDKIHLHNQYGGGSFGHRLEFEHVKQVAEIAKAMPGVPIKLTYSREEDFTHDFARQITMSQSRGSVAGGKVETADLSIASVSASASQSSRMGMPLPGPDAQIPAGAWNMPYAIENLRVRAYRVPELAPTSSWRSVGASSAGFFAESFIDELIHAAGADPLAERLRLINNPVAKTVLETAGRISNWGTDMGPNQGRGIALVQSFGTYVAEVVEVTNTDRGIRIDKVYIVADVGKVIDPIAFENQVQGGVVWGLGHAMNCEITFADGMVQQSNYHQHEAMRMHQCPEIIVHALENAEDVRGIGEPPVPPAAPALANAIFAATGQRIREMPFNKHIDFV